MRHAFVDSFGRTSRFFDVSADYVRQTNQPDGAGALLPNDGSDPTVTRPGLIHAVFITQADTAKLVATRLGNRNLELPIDLRHRVRRNPAMKDLIHLTPGWVAHSLQFVTLTVSAFAISCA